MYSEVSTQYHISMLGEPTVDNNDALVNVIEQREKLYNGNDLMFLYDMLTATATSEKTDYQ